MLFAPTPMRKVNIFLTKADVEQTTIALARLEQLHLIATEEDEWSEETPAWRQLAERYADQKQRLERLMESLDIDRHQTVPLQQLEPGDGSEDIAEVLAGAEQDIQTWKKHREDAKDEVKHLEYLMGEVQLLEPLDIPMEQVRNLQFLHWVLGTMPKENFDSLEIVLFRIPSVVIPMTIEDDDRLLIIAATIKTYSDILDMAMKGLFIDVVPPPQDVIGAPAEVLPKLRERLEKTQGRLESLDEERERLARKWDHRLVTSWRRVSNSLQVSQAITRFSRHRDIFLISGWVPESAADTLVTVVDAATSGRADVEVVEPTVGRGRPQPPTRTRNLRLFRPFEAIVQTFGFPDYQEIDPTPVTALSFSLMYGMMFGDVGHGLMLALFGSLINYSCKGRLRSLGAVLVASGLCSSVFGFLYGSLFGLENIIPTLWLNPLESIMSIMQVSIIGGIMLLTLGFLASIINAVRMKRWGELLLGQNGITAFWLYWALIGGGYGAIQGMVPVWSALVLIFLPTLLLLLRGPLINLAKGDRPLLEGGLATFGVQSFFELFETVVSDVSNTLSFVRLGAFAVAHAGLMRVVFLLAESSSTALKWAIIVAGTIIVVGFEGLVVAIQALRLEYYEFFVKFFRGGGYAFKPLRLFDSKES